MIFVAPYEKLDERKKITKSLKKNAVVLEAKELSEKEMKAWIREHVTENGYSITPSSIELLYQMIGPRLTILHNEIEKLFLYCENKQIDEESIRLLVSRTPEEMPFEWDAIVSNQLEEAMAIFHDLLKQNVEPIQMVAMISSQIRFLFAVKSLWQKRYSERQIASILKANPYRVKFAIPKAKRIDNKNFYRCWMNCRFGLQNENRIWEQGETAGIFLIQF